MTLQDSLTYTPKELSFGTSGLRGLETDMTDLECYINTKGFLDFLKKEKSLPNNSTISVAGDLRRSTPRILQVVLSAIQDSGHKVDYCGLIPTPALAYHALGQKQACVMVTGSHIPANRNGIKFYNPSGEVMKTDEFHIKDCVKRVRDKIYSKDKTDSFFDNTGQHKQLSALPSANSQATKEYFARYINLFDSKILSGKKIVIYQHSAVGRDMLAQLLQDLGAEVVCVQRSDIFIPIDTENVTHDDQANFRKIALENPGTFAIVSTDGDSDRPFVIDEKGVFYRGDILGLVVARELHATTVAVPISANDAIDTVLKKDSISLTHTKIGSPYVIEAMEKTAQNNAAVGWEVNGGFMTASDITYKNGALSALPTRDAFLPIIVSLVAAIDKETSLSELFAELPQRFTQAGLLDNFPQEISEKIITLLSKNDVDSQKLITENFTADLGFGEINLIDTTDGIRILFSNNDIAHIRPSGNAPQLRIYAIADSQERADAIVDLGIKDQGILRKLEASFAS